MTTFYLRLALLPIILLTAVLLLIRSQPYDDHELRELLLPVDCPAPCFMGIRPGVTTVEEISKTPHERVLDIQLNPSENYQFINSIKVKTSIPLGEIILLLGRGISNEHYQIYGRTARPYIITYYPKLNLGINGKTSCPMSTQKYWNTPMTLTIVSNRDDFYVYTLAFVCPRY